MIPEINNNEEILELILEGLNDLVDFELAVILKIRGKDRLEVQKAVGPLRSERLTDFAISLAERKDIAALMDAGKPYLFNEDEEHVDTYAEILEMPEGHSCLVSPLTFEDQPVGMLTLDHSACSKFSPEIVKFIGTISKLITIIIAQSDTSAYMLEKQKLLTEERNLLLSAESIKFSKVIGNSQAWHSVLDAVKLVAGSDVSVLIQGETGTGKEEIARLLHRLSARDGRPFVALNCSTLTPSLAESALFGHEKGAFTDAYSSRKGQFELADGGTLFLDEIGDLPMEVQPKLLRALQEGAFERVGGEKQIKCDVRIVAASHIDLQEAIGRKAFREDLYYRIGVFPLHLPALRERDNDVLLLADHFLQTVCDGRGGSFSSGALKYLLEYGWPGNVRELQNAVKRAVLLADGGDIEARHLSPAEKNEKLRMPEGNESSKFLSLDESVAAHIKKALDISGGRVYGSGGAAELLGLKPTTLQSRMKKLGIK